MGGKAREAGGLNSQLEVHGSLGKSGLYMVRWRDTLHTDPGEIHAVPAVGQCHAF